MEKVYLLLFSLNKHHDCFETISVHKSVSGVEKAIIEHQAYVYDNADVLFRDDIDTQTNLCVWTWKEVTLMP